MPAAFPVETPPVQIRSGPVGSGPVGSGPVGPGVAARLWHEVPRLVGLLLPVILLLTYAADPAVPGNHGRFPNGWWGWWDQSQYLLSARALASGDLSASHHWYPIGYAILGAPFTLLSTLHAFLLPDLLCCIAAYAGFLVFAREVGFGGAPAALAFLLATAGCVPILAVWAEPWNTTLSAALIWGLLALSARHLCRADIGRRRFGRCVALGAIAGFMPVTRPTDALLLLVWAIGAGAGALRWRRLTPTDLAALLLGGLATFLPAAGLWLAIHGTAASDYMRNSAALGFDFGTLGWRTALLLLAPLPWFPDGSGILQRLAWLLPGIAGLVAAPWLSAGRQRWLLGVLAAMMIGYSALFFSYVDLIPTGLWRYNNIHYFKWMLPGVMLFALLLLRRLLFGPWHGAGFAAALAGCLVALLLHGFRLVPRPVGDATPAWMVQLRGPVPTWDESYFGAMTVRDGSGTLRSIRDFRAMPDEQGWRLVALHRPFVGRMVISGVGHWPDGAVPSQADSRAVRRWGRAVRFKLPLLPLRAGAMQP